MSDEFRHPEHRTPSVTPSRALWLLFIVAIAAGAWLTLSLADPGNPPDQLAAGGAAAEESHAVALSPAAPVPVAASPGTSVPEASAIFNGNSTPVEEPTQTF